MKMRLITPFLGAAAMIVAWAAAQAAPLQGSTSGSMSSATRAQAPAPARGQRPPSVSKAGYNNGGCAQFFEAIQNPPISGYSNQPNGVTCTTAPGIPCQWNVVVPSSNVAVMAPPVAKPIGNQGAQFSYSCAWLRASQQQAQALAAQTCAPGFIKIQSSNNPATFTSQVTPSVNGRPSGQTSTMSQTYWNGSFTCTTPLIRCPQGDPSRSSLGYPKASLVALNGNRQAARFEYQCFPQ